MPFSALLFGDKINDDLHFVLNQPFLQIAGKNCPYLYQYIIVYYPRLAGHPCQVWQCIDPNSSSYYYYYFIIVIIIIIIISIIIIIIIIILLLLLVLLLFLLLLLLLLLCRVYPPFLLNGWTDVCRIILYHSTVIMELAMCSQSTIQVLSWIGFCDFFSLFCCNVSAVSVSLSCVSYCHSLFLFLSLSFR